jgi:hypothetical protein
MLLCYHDKYLGEQLKRGRIYFGSRFHSMVSWLHCGSPGVRQSIMAGSIDGATQLMVHRRQREREEGAGQDASFQDTPPVTRFLQPGPASYFSQPPIMV